MIVEHCEANDVPSADTDKNMTQKQRGKQQGEDKGAQGAGALMGEIERMKIKMEERRYIVIFRYEGCSVSLLDRHKHKQM